MAKTLVISSEERTRVPFLRGILTRTLQEAGLTFDEAYSLADSIRQDLADVDVISTKALREKVVTRLEQEHKPVVVDRYRSSSRSHAMIIVRDEDGQTTPFSRSQHRRCLESCSLSTEESSAVTQKMYEHLLEKRILDITSRHLGHLTYRCLHQDNRLGPAVAQRYLVWVDFLHSGRPLIILIGGTAGCGKSTVAVELANRLEIVRTQSTDLLREVMRMMIPKRLLPVLHTSSFTAWETLPHHNDAAADDPDALLADGYRTQAELLSVALEAVVNRALRERVSLILEGVHVQPSFVEKLPKDTDALVVPIMLAVLKPERLRKRIRGRGMEAPQRRAERYLSHFEQVWRLQSFLLSEADRLGVPIINNDDKEKVIREIMRIIITHISADFTATPREVFR